MTTQTYASHYKPLALSAAPLHQHRKKYVAGMTEKQVLFTSWTVEPELVRTLVPDRFEIDTYDGQTFASLVALRMHDVHLRILGWLPPAPGFDDFLELNLRTYVRYNGTPGIFFLSIDTDSVLYGELAEHVFRLPCHNAEMTPFELADGFRFESTRNSAPARFEATYRPHGSAAPAAEGSLEHFLCERYSYFLAHEDDVIQGCIHHDPWPIQPVDVDCVTTDLFESVGLVAPARAPDVQFYVEELQSVAWLPHKAG